MRSTTSHTIGGGIPATRGRPTLKARAAAWIGALAAGLVASAPVPCAAADAPAAYPKMAPVEAYLMNRAEEIALARSAAPDSISAKATVLVLTRTGYETAVQGSNGFVCMVGRGFSGAPDWGERWNPKIRAAECQNPQAARSVAPLAILRTALTLAGRTDAEIVKRLEVAQRTRQIPPLEAGAMSYMMSKSAYLQDGAPHSMAHLMFFIPARDGATWGANLPGAPVMGGSYWFFGPNHAADAAALPPLSVLIVGAATWSDGTPGMTHDM